MSNSQAIRELRGVDPGALPDEVLSSTEPLVLRGLVQHWPAVRAARDSSLGATQYLRRFCGDEPVGALVGDPEIEGRFFYNDDFSGFNFTSTHMSPEAVLANIEGQAGWSKAPSFYVGASAVDKTFPGFRAENDLDLGGRDTMISIWMGTRSRIAAHYDMPNNLACVVAGRRRFTLFPPEQLDNLYVGPVDFTPAGQAISLVDFDHPDFTRFPKFAEAMRHARGAELGAGDAIFIPSMWWHHVEALSAFNVLVNYWWRSTPAYHGSPLSALLLTLVAVRDLPPAQREAWHNLFRHYVFEAGEQTVAHIPERGRRLLGELDESAVRELRARILGRSRR